MGIRWRALGLSGLAGVACAYGLVDRATMGSRAPWGLWNVILDVTCSPQFLAYVITPLWLALTWFTCARGSGMTHLLRLGSRRAALFAVIGELVMWAGNGAAMTCIGAAMASLGLPAQAAIVETSTTHTYFALGVTPLAALMCRILLVIAVLAAISVVLTALRLLTQRWWPGLLAGLVMFAWVAVSANGWMPGWADIASAVDPAQVLRGRAPVAAGVVLAAAATGAALLGRRDRWAFA